MSNGQHYDWAKLIRQVGGRIDSRRISHKRQLSHATRGPDVAHEPFECPSCGDRFPVSEPCPRCVVLPFDARTGRCVVDHVRIPAHGAGVVPRLRTFLHEVTRGRAAARARRVKPPGDRATRKRVRIRGIVSVLRPVVEPASGQACGAYRTIAEVVEPCGCSETCTQTTTLVREGSSVGLLALRVGTEAVIVGVPRSVHSVASLEGGPEAQVIVHDGQELEVVGVLERRAIELPQSATVGYRETPPPTSVCMVGNVRSPCWLLAPVRSSS